MDYTKDILQSFLYEKTPEKFEGSSYVLPFGKWRGSSINDLLGTEAGRSYLQWLSSAKASNGVPNYSRNAIKWYNDNKLKSN